MIQRLVIVIIIVAAIAAATTILRAVQVAREPLVWRSGALARSMWLWGAATCMLVAAAWVIGGAL